MFIDKLMTFLCIPEEKKEQFIIDMNNSIADHNRKFYEFWNAEFPNEKDSKIVRRYYKLKAFL